MSYKEKSPIIVAEGGTGAQTLTGVLTGNATSAITANAVTQHGVVIGAASNAVGSTSVGSTGTVLIGTTSSDPSFSATPTVTSITFGAGSALSAFNDWASWTPTIIGTTTAGTTTYGTQYGTYMRIGNLAICQFFVTCSAATGTGSLAVGGLPFTIHNNANYYPMGSVYVGGTITWPIGATYCQLQGSNNTTFASIACFGSGIAGQTMVIANTSITLLGTLIYQI
jgi:hypothetical protein